MDGAILAAVMVAGQFSTKDLPQNNSSSSKGVELHLSPIDVKQQRTEELLEKVFKLVHEKFRPQLAQSAPVKLQLAQSTAVRQHCRPLRLKVYCICLNCDCGTPLSFAVRSGTDSVNKLSQLLTEDLNFMCPGCYYRHGE